MGEGGEILAKPFDSLFPHPPLFSPPLQTLLSQKKNAIGIDWGEGREGSNLPYRLSIFFGGRCHTH